MPDFFNTLYKMFLKQKSKLFFVLLFFIIAGILMPNIQPVSASWIDCLGGGLGGFGAGTILGGPIIGGVPGAIAGCNFPKAAAYLLQSGARATISLFLIPILFITGIFSIVVSAVLNWIMFAPITYATSNAVLVGWPIVRNFANILVVLALIIISLATILRFREYEAKKLLPALIIAALLINFSLVICGVFIDGSNIVMKIFLTPNNKALTENTIKQVWVGISNAFSGVADTDQGVTDYLMKTGGQIFYNVMTGLVLMLYLFLFLFRVIALWILLILSPLAFACYILPNTKKYFEMWWSNFFQWCIIGIAGGFFYYIASQLQNQIAIANPDA